MWVRFAVVRVAIASCWAIANTYWLAGTSIVSLQYGYLTFGAANINAWWLTTSIVCKRITFWASVCLAITNAFYFRMFAAIAGVAIT